ncbi:GDSL esterase/lipase At5g03610 isoform X2 [Gastrolobium bilobum]|uniref:GDSL esterase/lipase At5g03610 isoform X2 n=1 Tax=Gastrolobium bilobum TaxID=150636 RepID=UPI002AB2A92C|nr:GDSL esterase/lipase At5g03610 isoform X2 [Gastrolobium bilobum]
MMDSHKQQLFSLLSLFLILHLSAEARLQLRHLNDQPTKLFVFGDSYADTGNIRKGLSNSWKDPYGITFPGKPAGRFSDGRVLTDYIAKYLGVKSPVPYRLRKLMPQHLKYGMNFAVGGTGVFDTSALGPNMTTQIDLLHQVINDKVYTASDLSNSVALISVAGNDYSHYLATNGSAQGLPSFVASVVNQTTTNLIRAKGLGVKKIVVGGLPPLGCLPEITTTSSFQHCNTTFNALVLLHNNLLNQAVTRLNQETKDHSAFVILNLYDSFMSVLNHPSTHNIQNQFKPCCVGVSSEYFCGSVDGNNVKKYQVCDEPKSAFFWDLVHPTQAGWHAVYNKLRAMNALQQVHY